MSSSLPPGHQNAGGQYHNPAAHPSSGSSSANHQNYAKITREVLSKMEKVPAELVALTYGSLITQLLQDFNSDIAQVNDELDRMGEQIGGRLVDEFLSKTANIMSVFPVCCQDFRELCELVGSVGFKMYLGVAAEVLLVRRLSLTHNVLGDHEVECTSPTRQCHCLIIVNASSTTTPGYELVAGFHRVRFHTEREPVERVCGTSCRPPEGNPKQQPLVQ